SGVEYPSVMNASGTRGFFGEGYWYHKYWNIAGLTFKNCALNAKTTTMQERLNPKKGLGNMPMRPDGITPHEFFPKCIVIKPWSGAALNAVGLSGPGAPNLLAREEWQRISGPPWNLSFMSVEKEMSDRLSELREFVKLLLPVVHKFNAPVGLEMNFSCPNANVQHSSLVEEVCTALSIAGELHIPLQCKFNALASVKEVKEISRYRACGAIVMGNTIPWKDFPDILKLRFFGKLRSPLEHLGGGGVSGPPLRAIHCQWIREARESGITKPIWGCGGVDSIKAVDEYHQAGASGIQFGTVCITRPWRTTSIIARAHELFL
ncbi:MAG TPA: hypothetical protein VLG69_00910, partial [Candidatus Andersenbacteria bacterium]|nr:hypothetical protein [Candidatus Andersenbacteria bacterium]